MFKYTIKGKVDAKDKPITIALTSFRDIAEYVRDHAAEALDPSGEYGMTVSIIEHPDADCFIYPSRGSSGGE